MFLALSFFFFSNFNDLIKKMGILLGYFLIYIFVFRGFLVIITFQGSGQALCLPLDYELDA